MGAYRKSAEHEEDYRPGRDRPIDSATCQDHVMFPKYLGREIPSDMGGSYDFGQPDLVPFDRRKRNR